MSLRVWIPLNGDLTNNGLSNVTVTNNGATVDNNGKIGKCYYFNGSNQIKISLPDDMTTTKNTTVMAWVKSTGSVVALGGISYDNSTYGYSGAVTLYTSGWQFPASSGYKYVAGGSIANSQVWHHVACTVGDDIITTYLDGVVVTTNSLTTLTAVTTLDPNKNFIEIGQDSPGTDERLTGYVNDFRVYDHCLSTKEIKEISKGLVCHYKLDNGSFGGQDNIYDFQSIASKWTADGATREDYTDPVYGNVLKVKSSSGSKRIYRGLSNIWTEGQKYAVSFLAKADSSCICDMSRSAIDFTSQFTLTTEWKRYSGIITSTATAAGGTLTFRAVTTGVNVYITQIKLEYGEVATAYRPNKQDPDYNKLGYNNTTIYDSSGYNYHGEIWRYDSLGNIEVSSNSPRNSLSTYVNSENNTTNTASGTVYIYGHCELTSPKNLTVSFWCKPIAGYSDSVNQGQFCLTNISISSNAGSDYDTSAMNHRDSKIDFSNGTTTYHKTVSIPFTANEWHHYAISYDGRYMKVFKDGVQTATSDMGSEQALCSIKGAILGFSKAGGVWRSNKSYYSDFRLYTTTLSEDDVKELYNIPISISNNGSIFTQGEYVEV